MDRRPFLRIPPFPGHRAAALCIAATSPELPAEQGAELVRQLAQARVGGSFWGAQPALPAARDILLVPDSQAQAGAMLDRAERENVLARVVLFGSWASRGSVPVVSQLCDPWHVAGQAAAMWCGADSEWALVAAMNPVELTIFGDGRFAGLAGADAAVVQDIAGQELQQGWACRNPFDGTPMCATEAIAMLAHWRCLIDANRQAAAIFGIAGWKRVTMDALLWDGSGPPRYASPRGRMARNLASGNQVLAWKSRAPAGLAEALTDRGVHVGEVEDGMIRSAGLGANCVPPLSVIVDFHGAHFDPAQASGLELILQNQDMPHDVLARAAAVRKQLVAAGISKYGQDNSTIARPDDARRRVLVTGQVEDDRSVISGGAGCTNLSLIRRARECEGNAWLIYKPHPDVEAGHRKGFVPTGDVLQYADEIEHEASIAALIDSVDALHVITSLAGFEGLMRGTQVTTHGVPFYAGWGLTHDLGPVPSRRSRQRSLDELVAATLILYPRYLDPVTRLPCPVEVLVKRMADGDAAITSPLVWLREAQGQLNLMFKQLNRIVR
jgi:capsular polysaccharide export protein